MAAELVRVRMLRHVAQFIEVKDLEMGGVYELTREAAQKLIDAGVATIPVPAKTSRLEAAALAAPGRRG